MSMLKRASEWEKRGKIRMPVFIFLFLAKSECSEQFPKLFQMSGDVSKVIDHAGIPVIFDQQNVDVFADVVEMVKQE